MKTEGFMNNGNVGTEMVSSKVVKLLSESFIMYRRYSLTALLITIMLMVPFNVGAFIVDGLAYDFTTDGISVAVVHNYDGKKNVFIPSEVSLDHKTYSVTEIGSMAFYNCKDLESVIIPSSVTRIGEHAFDGCTLLSDIDIPNSVTDVESCAFQGTAWIKNQPNGMVYAGHVAYQFKGDRTSDINITIREGTRAIAGLCFYDRTGQTNVELPNSVIRICDYAFYECNGLSSIAIPVSVTSIGDRAFAGCTRLSKVSIPQSVIEIGFEAFKGTAWLDNQSDGLLYLGQVAFKYKGAMPSDYEITVKEGTKCIAGGCFSDCTNLSKISIPNSVTSIGEYAFEGCTGLTNVYISSLSNWCKIDFKSSSNPLSLAKHLYVNNIEVSNLEIPNDIQVLKDYVFNRFKGLTSLTIPNSVTRVGRWAFANCEYLKNVNIPNSVTSIATYAFNNCSGLTNVYISSLSNWCKINFSSSNSNPLMGAKHLYVNNIEVTRLEIPNDIDAIKPYAFNGFEGLTSVVIPNSVTSIGNESFSNCTSLRNATIPSSIVEIGGHAFYYCRAINDIYSFLNPVNTSLGDNVFGNVPTSECILHVPFGLKGTYENTSQWNLFDNIQEMVNYDLNGDGVVDRADYTLLVTRIADQSVYNSQFDLDGNGTVDVLDANILLDVVDN